MNVGSFQYPDEGDFEKDLGFHAGERAFHSRVGVSHPFDMDELAEPVMPMEHSIFFARLLYFAIATLDSQGYPIVTLLTRPVMANEVKEGFITALGPQQLTMTATPAAADPFVSALLNDSPTYFAGVGIDFTNRRRNKVAGKLKESHVEAFNFDPARSFIDISLHTTESLGNCPKYITVRKLKPLSRTPTHVPTEAGKLDAQCRAVINRASTIYIATRHLNDDDDTAHDMGVNHRGGTPGFVRVLDEPTNADGSGGVSYLILPDFSGNRLYQSLGNIESDQLAGVIFIDFTTGDTLQVSGAAENVVGEAADAIMPRVNVITKVKCENVTLIRGAVGLQLEGEEEFSPYNPPIRYLRSELSGGALVASDGAARVETLVKTPFFAKLLNVEPLSPAIAVFRFELSAPVSFHPGSYAILYCGAVLPPKRYHHMNDRDPKLLNDDYVRTWTISSAPKWDANSDSWAPVDHFELTIQLKRGGRVTPELHGSHLLRALPLDFELKGIGEDFQLPPAGRDVLWIAGGIGITPFLSMAQAMSQLPAERLPTSLCVLVAVREADKVVADRLEEYLLGAFGDANPLNKRVSFKLFMSPTTRLNAKDIAVVPGVATRQVMLCGSPRFSGNVRQWLDAAGLPSANLRHENFEF